MTELRRALNDLDQWWEAFGVTSQNELSYKDLAAFFDVDALQDKPAPVKPDARSANASTLTGPAALPLASNFAGLVAQIQSDDGCDIKSTSQNTVIYDGVPTAPVLIFGDAPDADADANGRPFSGKTGTLLDNMLAAIGLSRSENCLISNVVYWRPPRDRPPKPEELSHCRPFVERMVEIIDPKIILTFGGIATNALLDTDQNINALRGTQQTRMLGGKSYIVMPSLHPANLMRRPHDKARTWRDLLIIQAAIKSLID